MKPWAYSGSVGAAKSIMNRALVIQSFAPELQIVGDSYSEDVLHLQRAFSILSHNTGQDFFCGDGGTTLRFLLARLSREPGEYTVTGSERLLSRPHQPLFHALRQLGVTVTQQSSTALRVQSNGWQKPKKLEMDLDLSSQFISALLLSAWNLDFDLEITMGVGDKSYSYVKLTFELLQKAGMQIQVLSDGIRISAAQQVTAKSLKVDPDMSSCFTLACFAAFAGELTLENFPEQSLQPDFAFVEILKQVGASVENSNGRLVLKKAQGLKPINRDLSQTPDLFPVLAVLLSRAEGVSTLTGLASLKHKESDRLTNTLELLSSLGLSCRSQGASVQIQGRPEHNYPELFDFDPDKDHRMAMAAALAVHQGAKLKILNPQVVNKSFPEFWEVVS